MNLTDALPAVKREQQMKGSKKKKKKSMLVVSNDLWAPLETGP